MSVQCPSVWWKSSCEQVWASIWEEDAQEEIIWLIVFFRSLGGGASRVSYQSTQLYLRGHCDVLWCVSDGRCSEKRVRIMWNLPAEGFQTGLHVTPSSNSVIPPNLSLLNCERRIKEFLAHAPKGWTLRHKHAKCQPFHFALLWTIKVYHL